jgi:Cu-Zn family superoxide dismutase
MNKLEIIAGAALLAAAACTPKGSPAAAPSSANPAAAPMDMSTAVPETFSSATAMLHDAQGKQVGTVNLSDSYAGLLVDGTVNDLGLGAHGIHLHSVGKCEPPFTSAGGHFNPGARMHGYLNQHGPHLGDMPNIYTPAAGTMHFAFRVPGVTLKGQNALLDADGAAVVVHAGADDYKTDPAGNSGGRVACGVIVAK